MGILNRLQSWFDWLIADPAGFIVYLIYFAASILLTLMLHEIAHGYVAWKCGDPTAKMLGRLSLDPRRLPSSATPSPVVSTLGATS